jgi:translation initiation factor IF-2
MAEEKTIRSIAKKIGRDPELLRAQLKEANIAVESVDSILTFDQIQQYQQYIRNKQKKGQALSKDKSSRSKIVLKKPSTTQKKKLASKTSRTAKDSGRVNIVYRSTKQDRVFAAVGKDVKKTVKKESVEDAAPKIVEKTIDEKKHAKTSVKSISGKPKEKVTTEQKLSSDLNLDGLLRPASLARNAGDNGKEENVKTQVASKRASKKTTTDAKSQIHFKRKKKAQTKISVAVTNQSSIKQDFAKPVAPVAKQIKVPESITVPELAQKLSVKAIDLVKAIFQKGTVIQINQVLDQETAMLLVEEMGHIPIALNTNAIEEGLDVDHSKFEAKPRAPVVTIMGHVDHGKTSLLDYIRRTKVTSTEAGGITQHIGAYHVDTPRGMITFLDTPGHALFTAMRVRGAQCTDIVILVIAADDGVKPQTIEAIQHAKAAKVPIIIAVNKIDKPEADIERAKSELAQQDVLCEDWGGDVMLQPISAKTGEGVDELLERILLQAEILELTAVAEGPAKGIVLESRLGKGGVQTSLLVMSGELHKNDVILAGCEYGRIRLMLGDDGQIKNSAGPSMPIEMLGLSGTATAGDDFLVVNSERKAREVALFRQGKYRQIRLAQKTKMVQLDNLFDQLKTEQQKVLNIVLKTDVHGSVEAITDALLKLSTDEVKVNFIATGVGGITESDVNLALASNAIVLGFNVRANVAARKLIESEGVDLRYYSVIYELVDEVKAALAGLLAPHFKEKITGVAEVKDVFRSSKFGAIAGCMVSEGVIKRSSSIRVLRDGVVIFEGVLESLRRFKEDATEVRKGLECGIGVKDYNDIKVGDQIESYEKIEVQRKL